MCSNILMCVGIFYLSVKSIAVLHESLHRFLWLGKVYSSEIIPSFVVYECKFNKDIGYHINQVVRGSLIFHRHWNIIRHEWGIVWVGQIKLKLVIFHLLHNSNEISLRIEAVCELCDKHWLPMAPAWCQTATCSPIEVLYELSSSAFNNSVAMSCFLVKG